PDAAVEEDQLLTDIDSVDKLTSIDGGHHPAPVQSEPVAELLSHPLYGEVEEGGQVIVIFPWMSQIKERNELLIVAWLWYWFRNDPDVGVRAQIKRDGQLWAVTTYSRLARAIGLNKGQVQYALKQLVTQKVVICKHGWVNKYHIGKGTFLRFN